MSHSKGTTLTAQLCVSVSDPSLSPSVSPGLSAGVIVLIVIIFTVIVSVGLVILFVTLKHKG